MAVLDELLVRIDASTELLRRELAKGTGEVSKFEQKTSGSLDKIDKRFSLLGRGIKTALAAFGVAFSVRGIVNFTRSALVAGDALDEASKAAGTTAEQLQELRFAFGQLAGTTDGQVDKALQDFNKNLGLTIQGTGRAREQFASLGIVFANNNGQIRSTGDILEDTLKALAGVESDSVRAATAARLFGDEAGPKLAAALGEGLSAMEALRAATPGLLSNENVEIASKLDDAFDSMARTVKGGLSNALVEATGALADLFGLIERGPIIEAELEIRNLERAVRDLEFAASVGSLGGNQPTLDRARAELAALQEAQRVRTLVRPFGDRRQIHASAEQAAAERRQQEANERLLSPWFLRNAGSARNVPLNMGENQLIPRNIGTARNVDVTSAQGGFNTQEFESSYDEFLDRIYDHNAKAIDGMSDQWGDFSATISSTLHSTLSNAFQGISVDFKSLIKTMLADLAATGLLRAIGTTIGGPLGAFFTGGLPGATPMATGGPVTAGRPYVVGDGGRPELFVPNMSGKILPSTGGAGVVVNQTMYFPTNLQDVRAQIAAAAPMIARATEAKINESRVRRQ